MEMVKKHGNCREQKVITTFICDEVLNFAIRKNLFEIFRQYQFLRTERNSVTTLFIEDHCRQFSYIILIFVFIFIFHYFCLELKSIKICVKFAETNSEIEYMDSLNTS